MTLAEAVARVGRSALRVLIAMHPRAFRESFGATVIEESSADVDAAVRSGAVATLGIVGRALADAAHGVLSEWAVAIDEVRRAMQSAFLSDVRYAARSLWRDRSFSAVALGTLSVGLALAVTVAALMSAYLMRGLPYPESHRLFDVRYGAEGAFPPAGLEKLSWQSLADVVELEIAWDLDTFNLRGGAYPEVAQGTWVTPGYMEGFGVQPSVGRGFAAADFETGRPMVAIISHRLWQTRFNGDPAIVGRVFEAYVNDRPHEVEAFTVVGVLSRDHWHVNAFTDVLAPLRAPSYPYLVRLREGVPPPLAEQRITSLIRGGTAAIAADWQVRLLSSHASYVRSIRPLLLAVAVATGLVLLIACANVGVLFTVRATRRRAEMSVRQALGATAAQITRAAAAEPVLLGSAAVVLGVGLAWVTIAGIAPVVDHYLGRPAPGGVSALRIDPTASALTLLAGLVAIAICSLVPIWIVRRTRTSAALSTGQKGSTDGPAQRRARAVLIAVEVAASLTLLVGASLAVQSAMRVIRVDMGLDASGVLVGRFGLRQRAYPDAAARSTYYERVLTRALDLTGLDGLAFTNSWPLQQSLSRDVSASDSNSPARAGVVAVTPDYFRVLGIPIQGGRGFAASDRVGREPVALVSRTLAARLWASGHAIGQQLRIAPPPNSAASAAPLTYRVVGVVGDIRHAHTDDDLADAYVPLLQQPSPSVFAYWRVRGDAASVEADLRQVLAALDPEVGLGAPRRLAEILDLQRAGLRLLGYLLVVFAAFAAVLALVGIYGVIAYTVKQREREIAVRLAVGADRALITRMFVGQGARVLSIGLAAGIAGAVALGRILRTQLFGVDPAEPLVIGAMTIAFTLCGLVAIAWPAHAAAAGDPATALKE